MGEIENRDEGQLVGKHVVGEMGAGVIAGQEIVDLARFALGQYRRAAQLDGQLVLLGIEQFERTRELVEEGAACFGRGGEPLVHEGLEVGLGAVFGLPEGGALVDAALEEIPGQARDDGRGAREDGINRYRCDGRG